MALPLIPALVSVLGSILKKKLTKSSTVAVVVGSVAALATGENPFDSAVVLVNLFRDAWPHVLIVVGAVGGIAGVFRKAGASKGYKGAG